MLQDARSAVRGLRRNPGYTCAVILTLALGIGLNAAMYGLLSRLFLQAPPHVVDPDGIHRVWVRQESFRSDSLAPTGTLVASDEMDWADFGLLRADPDRFAAVAGYTAPRPARHGRGQSAEEVRVSWVTGDLFALLGTQPVLGRPIAPEDDDPAATPVAAIGHGYWKRRFAGAEQALGSTVSFDAVDVRDRRRDAAWLRGIRGERDGRLAAAADRGEGLARRPLAAYRRRVLPDAARTSCAGS